MPGVSAVGIERKDSRGDTASVLAERMPNLSQLRYLDDVSDSAICSLGSQ